MAYWASLLNTIGIRYSYFLHVIILKDLIHIVKLKHV